jgi:Zn-dependent peptidase ImmA (M78 family)
MARKSFAALITPQVLRWARESLGLSVQSAAEGLRIESQDLKSWERGTSKPTFAKLVQVAHYYRRSPAVFFLPHPPKEPDPLPDFRSVTYRRNHSLSRDCLLAIRRGRRLRDSLLSVLDERPRFSPPRLNLRRKPENQAEAIRKWLGVDLPSQLKWQNEYLALREWRAALELKGVLVLQFPFLVTDARGFSLGQRPLPVIVLNRSDAITARIFTLFHECVHLGLGESAVCLPSEVEVRGRPTERFCDQVAAAVLAPASVLLGELNTGLDPSTLEFVSRLARRLKVSRAVIARRLLDLERIDHQQYANLIRVVLVEKRPKVSREVKSGETRGQRAMRERGAMLTSLLARALRRGKVSPSEASEVLGVSVSELGALVHGLAE